MNTRLRVLAVALVLVLGVASAGCRPAASQPTAAPASQGGEIRAALIMPGVHTDFGWNYVAFEALSNLKSSMPEVKQVGYTELVEPGDVEKVIRDYIAANYNLILVQGYQYKEGVDRVVAEKPKGVYISIGEGSDQDLVPGQVSYHAPQGHTASYLLGLLAAGMSKSGKVGVISGMESVDVNRNVAGYKAGVKAYQNGQQAVSMTVVGNWDDPATGKKAAEAMLNAGIDVIYCMGDGTSIGVIQAVKEAREAGEDVYYIGYPSDQYAAFSESVLTSIVYDWDECFVQQAKDLLSGNFGEQGYSISLDKGITIAPFYNFEQDVPQELKARMEDARQKIISGSLSVPAE